MTSPLTIARELIEMGRATPPGSWTHDDHGMEAIEDFIAAARRAPELAEAYIKAIEALQKAHDLIAIPASQHGREERDAAAGITGGPRYSAGLRMHHEECAELLPLLKALLAADAGGEQS